MRAYLRTLIGYMDRQEGQHWNTGIHWGGIYNHRGERLEDYWMIAFRVPFIRQWRASDNKMELVLSAPYFVLFCASAGRSRITPRRVCFLRWLPIWWNS